MNGANIGLDLTAVKGVTKIADAKEQPDLFGQKTLSSIIRSKDGNGVFGGKSEGANSPFQGLL